MNYVLFHNNCMDGFGAAFSAWLYFQENKLPYKLIPCNYNEPFPLTDEEIKDSYKRAELERVFAIAKELKVLDHHPTAKDDLENLSFAEFDLSQSGAMLAWKHFQPNKPVPTLLKYIQDRDLWTWQLPHSKEVNMVIQGQSLKQSNLPNFQLFMESLDLPNAVEAARDQGAAILNFQSQFIEIAINRSTVMVEIGGHEVPACNSSIFESETCQALMDKFPNAPFAVVFYKNSNATDINVSLRSRGFDVSKIAELYNGGGHKAAAGCRIHQDQFKIKPVK
jgi:oligoribonuclease NrnB/cAMP/cGMP phosphodiesterase (DHH superfamily)